MKAYARTAVDALHMKAAWATPVEDSNTRDEPFMLTDGTAVDVSLMHDSAHQGAVY